MNKIFTFFVLCFAVMVNAQISMIGENLGTAWTTDVDLTTTDGVYYTLENFEMPAGEFKFRQNHGWDNSWGGTTFPVGVGNNNGGSENIIAVAGTYTITFNSNTGVYTFTTGLPKVSMIGQNIGTPWTSDQDLTTTDGINYSLNNFTFAGGEFKFRLEHSWDVNWGDYQTAFPNGTAEINANNIPGVAGTYNVTFNRNTGDFSFVEETLSVAGTNKALSIYPTRTSGTVFFGNEVAQVSIYDISGKLIAQLKNTKSADLSSLKSGVYILKGIANNGAAFSQKIIKN